MANVNSIQKTIGTTPTDFYFEDTAGRNIIATQQDTSLVAVKAYAVGDFFWYNNKLYKVKSAVSSGATIVLATDADEKTVGDELKAKVNDTPTFSQASTQENLAGSGETFNTILGKIKKYFADLKALAFVNTDDTAQATTKYLRGDGTWQVFPQGGHTMLPNPSSNPTEATVVSTIVGKENTPSDDNVASLYGISKWTNVKTFRRVALGSDGDIGATGIGTWTDTDPSSIVVADEADWWEDEAFYIPSSGVDPDSIEIKILFEPLADGTPIVLQGYLWDTDYNNGHQCGRICIKFANDITDYMATAKVAVDITYTRNEVV